MSENIEKNTEPLNIFIDSHVFSEFQIQWKDRGQVKNKSGEGAIRLWIGLPTELQAKIIESKALNVCDLIMAWVQETEVRTGLLHMSKEEREYFLRSSLELFKKMQEFKRKKSKTE